VKYHNTGDGYQCDSGVRCMVTEGVTEEVTEGWARQGAG